MAARRLRELRAALEALGPLDLLTASQGDRTLDYLRFTTELQQLTQNGSCTLAELLKQNPPPLPPHTSSSHRPRESRHFEFEPAKVVDADTYFLEQLDAFQLWAERQEQNLYKRVDELAFGETPTAEGSANSEAAVSGWVSRTLQSCRGILRKELNCPFEYTEVPDSFLIQALLRAVADSEAQAAVSTATPAEEYHAADADMSEVATAEAAAAAALGAGGATPDFVLSVLAVNSGAAADQHMQAGSSHVHANVAVASTAGAAPQNTGSDGSRRRPDLILRAVAACNIDVPLVPNMPSLAKWLRQHQQQQQQQQQHQQPDAQQQQQQEEEEVQQYVNVAFQQDTIVVVAEIKVPAKLLDAQGQPLNLAMEYPNSAHVKSIVNQAFTYMAVLRVLVGYVTGHDVMYLLERPEDNPDILCISKAIKLEPGSSSDADSPTTLAAMAWAQHKGLLQARLPPAQLPPLSSWARAQRQLIASSNIITPSSFESCPNPPMKFASNEWTTLSQSEKLGAVGAPSGQEVQRQLRKQQSELQQQQQRQQQQQQQQQQQIQPLGSGPISLPVLTLSNLGLGSLDKLGAGANSCVYKGRLGIQVAAIKVVLSVTALLQEASSYGLLKDLQGLVIPKLLGLGMIHSVQAGLYFLALSASPGMPLCSRRPIGPEVAAAVRAALQALHDRSVVHGDLRSDNILVELPTDINEAGIQGKQLPAAVLIDLATVQAATKQECCSEMQQLEQLLVLAGQSGV